MIISYKNRKLEKEFCSEKALCKSYGVVAGRKIMSRRDMLEAANALSDIPHLPPFRCHELSGKRKGQFAIDLTANYRLIFKPAHNPLPLKEDGGIDLTRITNIEILGVEDYH